MFRTIRLWWCLLRMARTALRASDDPEFFEHDDNVRSGG